MIGLNLGLNGLQNDFFFNCSFWEKQNKYILDGLTQYISAIKIIT